MSWQEIVDRLAERDSGWNDVNQSELRLLAIETSDEAVSYALAIANLTEPKLERSAFGWVQATARSFAELGV